VLQTSAVPFRNLLFGSRCRGVGLNYWESYRREVTPEERSWIILHNGEAKWSKKGVRTIELIEPVSDLRKGLLNFR
jgi:hypothetical protein